MLNVGSEIQLRIDRVSYDGGRGVGRADGVVVFVPWTAPEDLILCRITKTHKNFAEGELVKIIEPSPHRREPICPVFGKCGGCRWQNFSYEEQLKQKSGLMQFSLKRVWPADQTIQVIPSPNEFRYRNRIQVHKRDQEIGYFAEGSNQLVAIEDCYIADEKLTAEFQKLREQPARAGLKEKFEIAFKDDQVTVRDLTRDFPAFSQVNPKQNEELIRQVLAGITNMEPRVILDLYCGSGNFTFPLHAQFPNAKITGVETHEGAVRKAQEKAPNSPQLRFIAQDVSRFLREQHSPDLVLVNPPRAGLENAVIQSILKANPAQIAYVSCNLSTLARDLEKLKIQYDVTGVVGVDMFPQTEYVESVVHLKRR